MLKIRTIDQANAEDRRQRIVMVLLFSVGILGMSYLVYDYIRIMNYAVMSEDLDRVDPFIKQLKAEGLVHSFDIPSAQMIVHEEAWNGKSKGEKAGMITQLARYCAEKNNQERWTLTVLAKSSGAQLGGLGRNGLKVN